MKTMRFLIPILSLFFLLTACGNGHDNHQHASSDGEAETTTAALETAEEFQKSFRDQLESYFELSEALVSSDYQASAEKAQTFKEALPNTNISSLNDEQQLVWNELVENILERAENITERDDIEDQRYEFEYLSENLISIVSNLGVDGVVYHQRCPMVRGASADWLSKNEQISNPYHGDRMLRCGTVVAVID